MHTYLQGRSTRPLFNAVIFHIWIWAFLMWHLCSPLSWLSQLYQYSHVGTMWHKFHQYSHVGTMWHKFHRYSHFGTMWQKFHRYSHFGTMWQKFHRYSQLGLCDNTSISNSGMPNIKLYRQYLAIAQNVSLSRFDSLLLHSVLTSQIK